MDTSLRQQRRHAYENPRADVQALVPADARRILDLGCSSGALGAALKARQGAEIVGIELLPDYADDARPRLDRVVQGDLAVLAAREDLEADLGSFDCLIAADVLEHLVDPWAVLSRFGRLVREGGTAVVSVPNVRYWETFWQLGRHGTWPRRAEGIFDATHLRWFTYRDAYGLLHQAGFAPHTFARQMRLRPGGSKWDTQAARLARVPGIRELFTFQLVVAARRLPAR
jgi:2-polyprenyl-3-methyl-5-hydroxy-6-metoxy-1,4-benzoquinol methylase